MSFDNRYRKHKTFIENRWQPIDVKVILEEDPEKKISIIKAAQKKAVKEIQDQDELHAFIESNLDANAVFLGVCHGAQQYAQAHGATVENTRHMHRGERSKNKKWARKPYSS